MPLVWLLLVLGVDPGFTQNACGGAFPPIQPAGSTFLTPAQEGYVGEFFQEGVYDRYAVYRQPGLTEPLDRIVARLLQYLPPTEYRFQFTLVELGTPNAFAVPGGRIFVSRRLVAAAQDEDELAGVLAHEMGHVLSRQLSVAVTRMLRESLKVTAVGDRADVFEKMHALLETRVAARGSRNREDEQGEADRIAAEAVWRAGYDPAGLARILDRTTGNEGDTGSFLSDLFGRTRPETKRYREMLKGIEKIPASCRLVRPASDEAAFAEWRKRVTDLDLEDLLPVVATHPAAQHLTPSLRPDLNRIRYSPDGTLILAQDDSGINVVLREGPRHLFRIPALGARPAIFLATSQAITFETGNGRIETWSVPDRSRVSRTDLPVGAGCQSVMLSPDGVTAACITKNASAYTLIELATGQTLYERENKPAIMANGLYGTGSFSPDGTVFLYAWIGSANPPRAYDVRQRQEVLVRSTLNQVLHFPFVFLDNTRVFAVGPRLLERSGRPVYPSGIYSFPDGKQLAQLPVPSASLSAATRGDVLFVRPAGEYAVGALELASGEFFFGSTRPAIDRYGDVTVAELNTGELAFYQGRSAQAIATLRLPDAELYRARDAAHSPDLQWLAISSPTRGVVWNLERNQSAPVAAFSEAAFEAGTFMATVDQREPRPGGTPGETSLERYRAVVDLATGSSVQRRKLEPQKGETLLFNGRYDAKLRVDDAKRKVYLDMSRDTGGGVLWTREVQDAMKVAIGDQVLLLYKADSAAARALLKERPTSPPTAQPTFVLEVADLVTGKARAVMAIDDALTVARIHLAGRTLVIEDTNNRILAYSLDTGDRVGQRFGRVLTVSTGPGLVVSANQVGAVIVSDEKLRSIASFSYPGNVMYAGLDGAGKRLLVVSSAQDVYIEQLP